MRGFWIAAGLSGVQCYRGNRIDFGRTEVARATNSVHTVKRAPTSPPIVLSLDFMRVQRPRGVQTPA